MQAIALEAYGSPNGFMQVVFNTTTVEARNDWAMFKDFLNPETLERLVATNGQVLTTNADRVEMRLSCC